MKVINLKKCPSTQAYLTNFISKFPEFISGSTLVTTEHQTSGFGRKGNHWEFFPGSLAVSFTLRKSQYEYLTPLAIGVSCAEFFQLKKKNITLKWPNDLMDRDHKKVGGIICQQSGDIIVCGLGLNLNQKNVLWSSIDIHENPKSIAIELYNYLLNNKLSYEEIIKRWNQFCCHINQEVEIIDANKKTFGKFIGIDQNGSAQIDNTLEIKTISSGSLFLR
jgi:BirA family biotin operon repressor/biotin-[acetyl-CoA-carboxylase] ligase